MVNITEHELTVAIEALEEGAFQLDLRAKEVHPANKLTIQALRDIITRFKEVESAFKGKVVL